MWDEEVSEGVPHGDHNPPRRAWGSWRAQVGCAHLVHPPPMLFAPKILKCSEKIVLNFQSLRTFIFGSFFYCTNSENRQKNTILLYVN